MDFSQVAELEKELKDKIKEEQEQYDQMGSEELVADVVEEVTPSLEQGMEYEQEQGQELSQDAEGEHDVAEEGIDAEETPPTTNEGWAKLRRENKQKEKDLQEMRERLARIEGAQEAMSRNTEPLGKPAEESVDAEPDRDIDPEAWLGWKTRQQDKLIEELKGRNDKVEQQQQIDNMWRGVQSIEGEFKSKQGNSDYDQAEGFVRNHEAALLKLKYPSATDEQVKAHIDNQKLQLFAQLVEEGRNPAEFVKAYAKQLGYAGEKSRASVKKEPNLENIARNQRKNASLIGGTDAETRGDVSPEQLFSQNLDDLVRGGEDVFKKAYKSIR